MSSSSSRALSCTRMATRSPNISMLRSSRGGRLSSDLRRSRARSLRRNASICSGDPSAATANARSQRPLSLASGPDQGLGPERDRVFEGVVGPEVDGARDLRAVQEELRRARERRQIALCRTEKAESHAATVA